MQFLNRINTSYSLDINSYEDLHRWSIENISDFWKEIWNASDTVHSKSYNEIVDDVHKMMLSMVVASSFAPSNAAQATAINVQLSSSSTTTTTTNEQILDIGGVIDVTEENRKREREDNTVVLDGSGSSKRQKP